MEETCSNNLLIFLAKETQRYILKIKLYGSIYLKSESPYYAGIYSDYYWYPFAILPIAFVIF
jgi:hypothetical protein